MRERNKGRFIKTPILERFCSKFVILENGCWQWTASLSKEGYGNFVGFNNHTALAHKFSYEMFIGSVPKGMELDHLCRNRACVNPCHLEVVTHSMNVKRGISVQVTKNRMARITHCPRGHLYDQANTYIDKRGHRQCKTCIRERYLERRKNTCKEPGT